MPSDTAIVSALEGRRLRIGCAPRQERPSSMFASSSRPKPARPPNVFSPTTCAHSPSASPSGIPAIVDLGSAFTIANWAAGKLAGLEPHGRYVRYNGQASC